MDWDAIPDRVADDANLVKNTTQRVLAKALGAMENYYEYDDFGQPSYTKDGAYPLRANFAEGYNLSLTDDDDVAFRISAKPYKHVKGVLEGDNAHLDILKTALTSDEWTIGTVTPTSVFTGPRGTRSVSTPAVSPRAPVTANHPVLSYSTPTPRT